MDEADFWALERRLWTGGEDDHARLVDPGCVMAFPAPVGILTGPAIFEGLRGAPRWTSVALSERTSATPGTEVVVLAYRAEGVRAGAAPYVAYCTSTYLHGGDGWRLVQHQQTPL